MLVACRLAGLSALEANYAVGGTITQSEDRWDGHRWRQFRRYLLAGKVSSIKSQRCRCEVQTDCCGSNSEGSSRVAAWKDLNCGYPPDCLNIGLPQTGQNTLITELPLSAFISYLDTLPRKVTEAEGSANCDACPAPVMC